MKKSGLKMELNSDLAGLLAWLTREVWMCGRAGASMCGYIGVCGEGEGEVGKKERRKS
jgi:hypothetical protein